MVILLAISLLCSGCIASQKHPTAEQVAFQEEMEAVKNGYAAYQSEDFEEAQETFAILSETSRHDDIKRKALFGLALSKLILADNLESRNAAIDLWQQWLHLFPDSRGEDEEEDPRLLTPLLGRIMPGNRGVTTETLSLENTGILRGPNSMAAHPGEPAAASQLKNREAGLDDAGQAGAAGGSRAAKTVSEAEYKSALEDKTKEIKQLKTTLKKLKSEIHTLKEQIDSLETIHKMVQKKMKAIDTP